MYASSSSGGVYALDKTTGLVKWRVPFWDVALPSSTGNVGGLATDGKALYVSVADLGTYAIDLAGNVLWRVGARGGGEPAAPVVFDELLLYTLAEMACSSPSAAPARRSSTSIRATASRRSRR